VAGPCPATWWKFDGPPMVTFFFSGSGFLFLKSEVATAPPSFQQEEGKSVLQVIIVVNS